MTSRSDQTVRSTLLGFATCLGALACTTVPPGGTGMGGTGGGTLGPAAGALNVSGMSGGSTAGMNGAGGSSMGGMGAAGAPNPMAGSSGNPAMAGTSGAGTAGTGMGGAANAGTGAGGTSMGGAINAGASAGGADTGGAGGGGASTGGSGTGGSGTGGAGPGGDFVLMAPWDSPDTCTADATDTCGNIPAAHRLEMIGGDNIMPLLSWPEGPEGTLSYALVYHDHSFQQGGTPFVHWAMWNIPAGTTSVDADTIPAGVDQSSFQGDSWTGSGACGNVYELILYALSVDEYLPGGDQTAVRDGLEGDDMGLVLARDSIFGQTQDPCD